jgi:hypothetical protein
MNRVEEDRGEKNGMEWNGMEWNGMEWNGMEWNTEATVSPYLPSREKAFQAFLGLFS